MATMERIMGKQSRQRQEQQRQRGLIQQQWELFKQNAIPENAPEIQKKEMEKAFYFGVWSMMSLLVQTPDDIDDQMGAAIIDSIYKESLAFISQFKS